MARGPNTPWTRAMLDHLDDDRIYTIDEILEVGARTVPPGRALQERERNRERLITTGTGPRPHTTTDQEIRTGARIVARGGLHSLIRSGHVERHGDHVHLSGARP